MTLLGNPFAPETPRPEYPRPQFVRSEWTCLNGEWEFVFDDANEGVSQQWFDGRTLDRRIIVPFPYQSPASQINEKDVHVVVWYARSFTYEAGWRGKLYGGAKFSELHANFMINADNATAADLEGLGEAVRTDVKTKLGIDLQWEIKRIGKP